MSSLTPEDWTALKSILCNADVDDWRIIKYEAKLGIQRTGYDLHECEGLCKALDAPKEYAKFLTPLIVNGKTFYLCRDCLHYYDEEFVRNGV